LRPRSPIPHRRETPQQLACRSRQWIRSAQPRLAVRRFAQQLHRGSASARDRAVAILDASPPPRAVIGKLRPARGPRHGGTVSNGRGLHNAAAAVLAFAATPGVEGSADMANGRADTVRLQHLSWSFGASAALFAAIDLDVFTRISEGAGTIDEIARAADMEARNAERLLVVLHALDLVERAGERFRNAPDVERFLVRGKPSYAGPWIRFAGKDWKEWGDLGAHLRRKGPPRRLGMYEALTVEGARKYHEATYSVGLGAGRRFAKQVDLSKRKLLLDLGGGSGAYSIAAALVYPGLRAIVLDLPPVVEVTKEFVARHRLSDRISTVAADFTAGALPRGADVIVMASNLPQYAPDVIRDVVCKAFAALAPGGEMHLVGEMLRDDRKGPLLAGLYALYEAIFDSGGVAHAVGECIGYLTEAGFDGVRASEFIPEILTRVSGTKRAA
jgi:O-methyltransferase/methyltransferase family protein